jgi:hypothetical protein
MSDWKSRLLEERSQLDGRLHKLTVFLKGDEFKSLPQQDRDLLTVQRWLMEELLVILDKRIVRVPKD